MNLLRTQLYAPADGVLDFLTDHSTGPGDKTTKKELTEEEKKAAADAAAAAAKKAEEDKKKGKGKEEQIGEIRKQRDELKAKLEALEKDKEKFDEVKPLLSVKDYIAKKFGNGKVDEEAVNKFIEHNKGRKKSLEDTTKKYTEKELLIRDLEITKSDLWINEYAIPLGEATNSLFATLVMVDKEGKPKHPELVTEFRHKLLNAVEVKDNKFIPPNAIKIKQMLAAFAAEYKKTTGEDYEIPKINDVVDDVKSVSAKYEASVIAKTNWETTAADKQKEKLYDQAKKGERDIEAIVISRNKDIELARDEFKYDELDGIVEEEEVKSKFQEVHNKHIGMIRKTEKPIDYHEFSGKMVKAELYDGIVKKFRELEAEYKKEFKKKYAGAPASSSKKDDEERRSETRQLDSKNPLSFLAT